MTTSDLSLFRTFLHVYCKSMFFLQIEYFWEYVYIASTFRSATTVQSMNRQLGDVLQISTSHNGPSHMWTSETLGEYLKFLGVELRRKRKSLGLDARAKALIMMDKAPQHQSSTFKKLRERFEHDHNCLLLHGESFHLAAIPGGWVCVTNYEFILYLFMYMQILLYIAYASLNIYI